MQPAVCSCAPAIAELCSAREAGRTQRELIHGCACWDGKDLNAWEKRLQQVFSLVYFLLMKCQKDDSSSRRGGSQMAYGARPTADL